MARRHVQPARWWRWTLLVVAVFLAANHLVWRGKAVGIWDAANQAFPYFVLVADHARAGHLVHWDPWTEAGLPLGGEPQVGAYSPVVVALGLLGGGRSSTFIAYWLLSWALGGIGVLALGRHLGAPPWGACAVALGFLFCGVYTGNAEHLSWVAAFSFVPLVLWRLDVALVTRSARAAVQAGALWGLSALAGHPSIIILGGGYAALWALGRVLFGVPPHDGGAQPNADRAVPEQAAGAAHRGRPLTAAYALGTLVLVCVVGVVVLAPTYVSTLRDGAGVHSRSAPLPKSEAVVDELPPGGLATIASAYPSRAKFFNRDVLWPRSDVSMVSVYAGVLIPVLAVFALLARARDRWRWWIAALALLSLACAMGEALPFHGWLYDWVYPVRYFRHSSVFRLFYVVSVTVLALLGTRELALALDEHGGRRRRRLAAASFASALVATVAYAAFLYGTRDLRSTRFAPVLIATWLGAVALGVALARRRSPVRLVPALIVLVAVADALATSVVSRLTMIDTGAELAHWRELDRRHATSLDLAPHELRRVLASCANWDPTRWCDVNDQMITKVPVLHGDSPFKNAVYTRFLGDSTVRGFSAGGDRIWFSPAAAEVPRSDSAVAAFMRATRAAGAPPLVIHGRAGMLAPVEAGAGGGAAPATIEARIRALPAARRIHTDVLAYGPNELALAVDAPERGWLLVTDRWAPRWGVTVNGRPAELLGGAFLFRAVPVPAGPDTVRFTYRTPGFPLLVIASWGVLAIVALDGVRRSNRPP